MIFWSVANIQTTGKSTLARQKLRACAYDDDAIADDEMMTTTTTTNGLRRSSSAADCLPASLNGKQPAAAATTPYKIRHKISCVGFVFAHTHTEKASYIERHSGGGSCLFIHIPCIASRTNSPNILLHHIHNTHTHTETKHTHKHFGKRIIFMRRDDVSQLTPREVEGFSID